MDVSDTHQCGFKKAIVVVCVLALLNVLLNIILIKAVTCVFSCFVGQLVGR